MVDIKFREKNWNCTGIWLDVCYFIWFSSMNQWRIQDFQDGGFANPKEGRQPIFRHSPPPQNCMELKKKMDRESGARVHGTPGWIRQWHSDDILKY